MSNRDISAAWQFHEATKHSYQKLRTSRHVLDWASQPIPYKIYPTLESIPLPTDFLPSAIPALDAIAATGDGPAGERVPDLHTLARLCYFANGITRCRRYSGGEIAFRAAACTGALYHIELYLVCGDLPDLAAGIYHYGAHDHALRQLRSGDYRGVLVEATGVEPSIADAPVMVISTSTFWRNAWKYQARAYRHAFWDNGTILANLMAVAAGVSLPARLVLGFADGPVNRLLDVDPRREAAISLVGLGRTTAMPLPAPEVPPLALPTVPLSPREVEYPEIGQMHQASSLLSGEETAAWRAAALSGSPGHRLADPQVDGEGGLAATRRGRPPCLPNARPPCLPNDWIPWQPLDAARLPLDPIETVIRRRGSARRLVREAIGLDQLSTLLERAARGIPADCFEPTGIPLNDAYLIVNAIDGLRPGAYVLHEERSALELLKADPFRREAGWLALDQELGADAAVDVFFLADLGSVLGRFGNRGYRAAQLAAAITAGKLYLAAYALHLGATGLTFFDDDVTTFFSPHAAGKSVMFLLSVGRPPRPSVR